MCRTLTGKKVPSIDCKQTAESVSTIGTWSLLMVVLAIPSNFFRSRGNISWKALCDRKTSSSSSTSIGFESTNRGNELSIACFMYCDPSAPSASHNNVKCFGGYTDSKIAKLIVFYFLFFWIINKTLFFYFKMICEFLPKLSVSKDPTISKNLSRKSWLYCDKLTPHFK